MDASWRVTLRESGRGRSSMMHTVRRSIVLRVIWCIKHQCCHETGEGSKDNGRQTKKHGTCAILPLSFCNKKGDQSIDLSFQLKRARTKNSACQEVSLDARSRSKASLGASSRSIEPSGATVSGLIPTILADFLRE